MKKQLLFASAAVMLSASVWATHSALSSPAPLSDATEVDYDLSSLGVRTNKDNKADRYLGSVVLSANGGEEVTIGPISSPSDYSIYYDKHDQSFSAPAGAEVTVKLVGSGSWIHNYAYVDWASDGFNYSTPTDYVDLNTYLPLEGSDLVWYSCWRKSTSDSDPWKNSRGETVSNNQNTDGATYTFTIPAGTPAGDYRMRVKTAWQSLDPNGKIDTSASNNTIQDNGGTIVDFTLTVTEAPVVEPAHTYMYFEANRKSSGNIVWGSYLQDANEAISGSSVYNKTSTLCGSDELNINCVWEITPGTEEGAYHVQNFVTKKYLVNLVAYGSTTLDEPVNIWFHDLTRGDKSGIQIGISATVNNNCLDQDNCDRLVGMWAGDDGNLWFPTTMDATTPEEVEAFFTEGEDPRIAVIQKKIDDTKALCELYKVSAPMAAEAINELMTAFEAFTPEFVLEQDIYDELDEMIASMVVAPVEEAVVAALNESLAGNYYWTLQGMRRANGGMASYLSGGTKANTSAGWPSFLPVNTPTDGTDWSLISNGTEGQFIMQNVSTSKYIGTPAVHYCKVVDTAEEAGAFTFGVRDGYVIFNSVAHPGKGLSFDNSATDPVEIYDVLTDIGAIWAVSVSTERGQEDPRVAEVREKLEAAFALADLYKESVPMAADDIEASIGSLRGYSAEFIVSNNISDSQLDQLLQQTKSTVEQAVVESLNNNIEGNYWTLYEPMQPGYLSAVTKATNKGYDSFNYQAEVDKDTRWTLVPATDGQFKMLSNKGQYIGTPAQNYCKVVDSADEAGLFTFGIKEGYVNFLSVAFPGCALGLDCKNDPAEIMTLEDGSNGYRWQVSVAAIPAGGDHTYMYFEAYRKASGEKVWGSYLQDADNALQGEYKSSSLCGSDTLNINCVWEITPGTVEGAYHVQNFATKKYLVDLIAYGSTTLDEPVNIWFHDLTIDGNTGIQIGTGATVNNNCLDQDNCDRLVGMWANDNGNLWFPATMDATTPEEVYEYFGLTPPATGSLVDVFSKRIDEIKEICALYLESVPFAGQEATVRISALDQIKAAAAIYVMECTNEEEAIAAANRVALEPVEKALLADINADMTSSAYVLYNTSRNGYLSSSFNYNDATFVTLSELNAGCMWGFDEAGNITALNSAQTMKVAKNYAVGGKCGPQSSECKQPMTLSFGLKNGYVVLNTNVAGGYLAFDGSLLKVLDNTTNGLWKVQKLTAADFKEAFIAQLTIWGGNVPGGAAIVEEGLAQVEAAADVNAVSAAGVALREALVATLAPSDKAVTLKNVGANGYLGYEFGWYTQDEANEIAEFEFEYKSGTGRYVLRNKETGLYITAGNSSTETLADAMNIVFLLHNNGYVVARCAESDPGYQNALRVTENGELSYGNENNSHEGAAAPYYCWTIAYAGEEQGGNTDEMLAEINLRLEGVKALAESYVKHVPFAADAVNELLPYLEEATAEDLLEYYDVIDVYVQEYMIEPIQDAVVAAAHENAGKPWTLYQPGQGAYLGSTAKATNQGWDSFNYQAEADYTGYWTAVKVSDGIYVMKSAKGQFIGTPKVHYCRVEDSQEEAGEFTIVAKEGYLVFNSIAHPGNSLGLDGKNDPVEIMNSEDGSRGYLWQVDLYTGESYEKVSISEIEAIADDAVIYDLQGRRVKNVSTGLYIVDGVKTMIRK